MLQQAFHVAKKKSDVYVVQYFNDLVNMNDF